MKSIPLASPAQFQAAWALTLSPEQMDAVCEVAARIRAHHVGRKIGNGHGAGLGTISTADEVGGLAAELALSLMTGGVWAAARSDDTAGPDIGERTQVRALLRPSSRCLLVRPYDLEKYGPDAVWCLVQMGPDGVTFSALAWCWGWEVEYLGRQTDGGDRRRPGVWLVNPHAMHKMRTMPVP